jgi:CDP-glycerol glycerophosphotransferase (TagB/SpsB family)
MKKIIKSIIYKIIIFLNKVLPKSNRVLVQDNFKGASNAIEIANYISEHYEYPVFYIVDKYFKPHAENLVSPNVRLLKRTSLLFVLYRPTSKYILSTHGFSIMRTSGRNQFHVNLWHGVGHKKIRLSMGYGEKGIPADITVATSELSRKMFSESFGVSQESVFISGYPRNDLMLRAQKEKQSAKANIKPALDNYDKVIIWLPTFRRKNNGKIIHEGKRDLGNPFNIKDFNTIRFSKLLKQQNTLCIFKPHYTFKANYYDESSNGPGNLDNILVIDDQWIYKQKITLYHLLACTDALITDFSSVMIDYSLLGQPIICFSSYLEEFKQNQGLYFENIENWLPTQLIQDEEEFFTSLELILSTGKDPYTGKRKKIRDLYFKYKDAKSSERLSKHIFGHEGNKVMRK